MPKRILPYHSSLVDKAKELRNHSTFSEVCLWKQLNKHQMMGYDFDRQKSILRYIVDFFCSDLMLAIEVDGITHWDDETYAKLRQQSLEDLGISFLRFDAMQIIRQTDWVATCISNWIEEYELNHPAPEHVLKRRLG